MTRPEDATRDRFREAVDRATARIQDVPALADVRTLLGDRVGLLDRRMRVAVVGRICQGKSTLVNALIGRRLTPTGTLELSYSVNHIRHGSPSSLTVHFKDGTDQSASLADLERYAARRADNRDLLAAISHLEVVTDSPHLLGFDLIDTAGLDSIWGEDSDATLEFLRLSRTMVHERTVAESAAADALIVVLSWRGMAQTDQEMLRAFAGPESDSRSPVTTTAVMTKVEDLWSPDCPDPLAAARSLIDTALLKPSLRRMLFEIQPVCGLLAQTAATLDEHDLADLDALRQVPAAKLEGSLYGAQVFQREDRGLPLDATRRKRLYDRFTGYGLLVATLLLRDGVDTVAALREELDRHSGLVAVRARLANHFTHRADLIKIRSTAEMLHRSACALRRDLGDTDRRALDSAVAALDSLLDREPGLDELDLLQLIATGELTLAPDEERQVLCAVGEYGRSTHERLDLPAHTSPAELRDLAAARAEHWHELSERGIRGRNRKAARVVHVRYQNLLANIEAALRHLEDPR